MKEAPLVLPSFGQETRVEQTEAFLSGEKKIQDLSNRMNLFMEKRLEQTL